ncbi:MAG: Uma2 family endonuclease [Isosphaeraceae bacterium]
MSTVLIQPAPLTLPSPADVYRITVDQYDQMVQLGTIGEHARVELLGGILVRKMPKNPDHTWAVESLKSLLDAGLPAGWHARQEQPVRIPDYDEPEPDIAIVRLTRAALRGRHPGPADLALLAEVADSSIADDRGIRYERSARAGIPVYWIINLRAGRVEVYTDPDPSTGRYLHEAHFGPAEAARIELGNLPALRIPVADLLPPPPGQ